MEPTLSATLFYRDPKAALAWLRDAFGFDIALVVTDDAGNVGHSTMRYGDGEFSLSGEWSDPGTVGRARMVGPGAVDGANTQFMRVRLREDLAGHLARARAAGARITQEPQDQFYGERIYRALDLEGHVWTFGEPIEQVSDEAKARGAHWNVRPNLEA